MTDIFFSYSSKDRDLVRPVRDALAGLGFDVFWDQSVPPGVDWDTWIRGHLNRSKCAVVFWSPNAVASDNVRHEATVAKQQGKLLPVLLETLTADQFPMGLYVDQAVNLADWSGDERHGEWLKLQAVVEEKLKPHAPLWLQRTIHSLDADLTAERARVRSIENRARTLHDRIAQDANAGLDRERERDEALEELAILKARLTEAACARADLSAKLEELTQKVGAAETARKTAADRLAMVEALNADTNTARTGAESRIADLIGTLERVELERGELTGRCHGLETEVRRLAGGKTPSSVLASWMDLIIMAGIGAWLMAIAAGFLFSGTSVNVYSLRHAASLAGIVALLWSAVILVRLPVRQRGTRSIDQHGPEREEIAHAASRQNDLRPTPLRAPNRVLRVVTLLVAAGLMIAALMTW